MQKKKESNKRKRRKQKAREADIKTIEGQRMATEGKRRQKKTREETEGNRGKKKHWNAK